MVCRPANPKCNECPIESMCLAKRQVENFLAAGGTPSDTDAPKVTDYPIAAKSLEKKLQKVAVCVLKVIPARMLDENFSQEQGLFLLLKRPSKGLLAGLWEFPTLPIVATIDGEGRRLAMTQMLDRWFPNANGVFEACGKDIERSDIGEIVHVFSHIRMTLIVETMVIACDVLGTETAIGCESQWVPAKLMHQQPLSSMVKKVWTLYSNSIKGKEQKPGEL